jgi:hypothetical protein
MDQSEQHPKGGRLAGSVRPEEPVHLARAHREVHAIHGGDMLVVDLLETLGFDDISPVAHLALLASRLPPPSW